ncbi:MAG TPA: DHA2 family efflux MFS transporter permease subunit [Solirubrobacterales bacterium]|nr:DHA2 family efflux MFS transporter permease subunit [Solirubrobacterales bacterium]
MSPTNDNIARSSSTSDRSRWIALVILCVGMLMIVLDATIVNVALPKIQADLGFSQSSLAWVINAYLITFGGLLLLAGRLGDLLGRRDVFLGGLVLFTGASLACGLADSQTVLVVARFIQGVGGALTSAVILGMIVTMFPEPGEQAKAIGVYSFVASAGGSVGLLAGGAITQAINWHWIFIVNLPIAVVTGVLTLRYLQRDKGMGFSEGADLPGAGLIVAALMIGVYAIVEASDYGWGSAHTLGFGAAAVALLVGFVIREGRAAQPLVPLRIFRSRNLSGANAIQALMIAGMYGMFFLGALYLQKVLGFDSLEVGVAFLPVTAIIGTLSLGFSAKLNMRFGAKATLVPGLVAVGAGLALFTQISADGSYWTEVLPGMVLVGIGAGLSFPAVMTLAMSGVKPEEAGLASGLVNTTLQVGAAIGLAVLATLSTNRTTNLEGSGAGVHQALTSGYQLAFVVGAALLVVAIGIALMVLRSGPAASEAAAVEAAEAEPVFSSEAA